MNQLRLVKTIHQLNFIIKYFDCDDYNLIYKQMQTFTQNRNIDTNNEIWLVRHLPVFTLGVAGLESHILFNNHNIPIIRCDRGGQVTYHGPGQIVAYVLIDLKREQINIRELVTTLENSVITHLNQYEIDAMNDKNAPGVYVDGKKIASIGLRIKNNCSYHGISYNIDMDLIPFSYINVCGYTNLEVVQLRQLVDNDISFVDIQTEYVNILTTYLSDLFIKNKGDNEKD